MKPTITAGKVVIRTTGEQFVWVLDCPPSASGRVAKDLNVFFASQGLNYCAKLELDD